MLRTKDDIFSQSLSDMLADRESSKIKEDNESKQSIELSETEKREILRKKENILRAKYNVSS